MFRHPRLVRRLALTAFFAVASAIGWTGAEAWVPPAIAFTFDLGSGVVTINGTSGNDVSTATWEARNTLRVTRGTLSATYSSVKGIAFNGYDGNDSFTNSTMLPSVIDGGDGDDVLTGGGGDDIILGGKGQDTIYGNEGNDTLIGSAGSDTMSGGGGNDLMKGESGMDLVYGDEGDDRLYGGPDSDWIHGDLGQDVIVSIGGSVDTIAGGSQTDNFWVDAIDVVTDAAVGEQSLGYLHEVEHFFAVSYNGGSLSTPIGKELDGADLPDPLPYASHTGLSLQNFASSPLFAAGGPTKDDFFQGEVGDCYLLAPLSAAADAHPDFVPRLVADLGDGTYAVRFYRDGQPQYVRVDADLWVAPDGKPKYARFGQQNSLWVPIVEKAYAFFRTQQGNYASLDSGDGTHHDHLGATKEPVELEEVVTPLQVIDWVERGSPAGAVATAVNDGVVYLLNWIALAQANGEAVYTGARSGISDSTPLVVGGNKNTYRSGQHQYMVDHVEFDDNGQPVVLVLRDPYGKYRRLADFARIYFCIGRAVIWRP